MTKTNVLAPFGSTSVNPTTIYLPCEITDDLLYVAAKALWAIGQDIGDIANVQTYFLPHTSRTKPYCGYRVEVLTADKQHLVRHISADISTEQTVEILDRFFAAGAPGLDHDVRECYINQHRQYKNRHHKKSA